MFSNKLPKLPNDRLGCLNNNSFYLCLFFKCVEKYMIKDMVDLVFSKSKYCLHDSKSRGILNSQASGPINNGSSCFFVFHLFFCFFLV